MASSSTGNHDKQFGAATLALLLIIFFYPVLFLGKTLLSSPIAPGVMNSGPYHYRAGVSSSPYVDPGSPAWVYEPLTRKIRRELLSGRIALWNDDNAAGAPLAADMQSAVFFLPRWPLVIAPYPPLWDFYLLFRLWMAGYFTYLFLRRIEVGRIGASTGAAAFMLSGYFIRYLNMGHLDIDCLLPVLMYSTEALYQERSPTRVVWLAAAVSLSVLGGMPESTFFVLAFTGFYALYRATLARTAGQGPVDWRILGRFSAGAACGLLLSAILLGIFFEFLANAWTAHSAVGATHLSLEYCWSLVFSFLSARNAAVPSGATQPYVGLLAFLIGSSALQRRTPQFKIAAFLVFMQVILFLKWYGLLINRIGELPVLKHLIFTKYASPEFAFGVAVLAGIAVGLMEQGKVRLRTLTWLSFGAAAAAACCLWHYWPHIAVSPSRNYVLRGTGFQFILVLVLMAVLWMFRTGGIGSRAAAAAMFGLVTVELGASFGWEFPPRVNPFRPAPFVQFLNEHAQNGRDRIFAFDSFLYPNTSSVFDLDDIRVLEAIYIDRYLRFVQNLIQPSARDRFTGAESPAVDPENPALGLLNVRYLVALNTPVEPVLVDALLAHGRRIKIAPDFDGIFDKTHLTVNGQTKLLFFQHAPARIDYPLAVLQGGAKIAFSLGMNPQAWDKCAGVQFEIQVTEPAERAQRLFSKYIDPKKAPADRKWHDATVDLGAFRNEEVLLSFITSPKADSTNAYGWAGWGALRFAQAGKEVSLIRDIVQSGQPVQIGAGSVEEIAYRINDVTKPVMFEHPPSRIDYVLRVAGAGGQLKFSLAMDPRVWSPDKGDGVEFAIEARRVRRKVLYSRLLNPRAMRADRRWVDGSVDLSPYRGRRITLSFITRPAPGATNAFAWAGWGDLRLDRQSGLKLVYDREVRIYENTDALPRAFLVHRASVVKSREEALEKLKEPGFPYRTTVVLEEPPATALSGTDVPVGPERADILQYQSNRVRLHAAAEAPALLFLSDTYYPGWKARVDGHSTKIYVADYAFRAVEVPAGSHEIEFYYDPWTFKAGSGVTLLTLAGLVLYWRRSARGPSVG